MLLYLAVAHFGRGRGDWGRAESPAHWQGEVQRQCAEDASALEDIWRDCADAMAGETPRQAIAESLEHGLDSILKRLYPAAGFRK